jgi:23S rRNA (guanosine2251-2'-O)-methyltransferase
VSSEQFVYGIHPVNEALDHPERVEKVYVKEGFSGQPMKDLIKKSRKLKIPCFIVPTRKLDQLTGTKNHQGCVAALSAIGYADLEAVLTDLFDRGILPRIMVLDGVTDVRNFGAIARTAECMGFHALVVPARGSARLNDDAVKSSAGALLKIPVCRTHVMKQAAFYLKHSGLRLVAATEKAQAMPWECDMSDPIAIVVGSEETGISNAVFKLCDQSTRIPLMGSIQSLNVSVAAGIMAYEAVKQSANTL